MEVFKVTGLEQVATKEQKEKFQNQSLEQVTKGK